MAEASGSTAYDRLMMYHSSAYSCIRNALETEETTDLAADSASREDVINVYKRGKNQLQRGLDVDLYDIPEGKKERAEKIRAKMQANLSHVEDRIDELTSADYQSRPSSSNKKTIRPSSAAAGTKPTLAVPPKPQAKGPRKATRNNRSLSPRVAAPNDRSKPTAKAISGGGAGSRGNSLTRADIKRQIGTLKGVDTKLAHSILDQVLEESSEVTFDDVIGLESAKQALREAVVLPALNPDVFTGLRSPARGILLFGPPGNGKTMLAKAVANEGKCVFFNISASALTSKWVGEAEKLVKALFAMARQLQPAMIFIDEIDSILCIRSEKDNEVSRRLKTEFLLQFDGVGSAKDDRVIVMGATNRPFELDDAVIRRFPKRISVSLPAVGAREHLLRTVLTRHKCNNALSPAQLKRVAAAADRYSNSDLQHLAEEASLGPVREISPDKLAQLKVSELRPVNEQDFMSAMNVIRPSTNFDHMKQLDDFARKYGEKQR